MRSKSTANIYQWCIPFTCVLLGLLLLASCASTKSTSTIWIHSTKSECSRVQKNMQCLSINRTESLEKATWEFLYTKIDGFRFEPGYFQKIKIKEILLDKKTVPADGTTVLYTLKKILKKKKDQRFEIDAIWIADRIFGRSIPKRIPVPKMEINVSKMKFHGKDSCNRNMGSITSMTTSKIEFGAITTTKMRCPKMITSTNYHSAIQNTKRYNVTPFELTLLDANGNETLHFKKEN